MTLSSKHSGIKSGIGTGKSNRRIAAELGVSKSMVQKHRSGETGRCRDTCHIPVSIGYFEPEELPIDGCENCRARCFYGICGNCGRLKEIGSFGVMADCPGVGNGLC